MRKAPCWIFSDADIGKAWKLINRGGDCGRAFEIGLYKNICAFRRNRSLGIYMSNSMAIETRSANDPAFIFSIIWARCTSMVRLLIPIAFAISFDE